MRPSRIKQRVLFVSFVLCSLGPLARPETARSQTPEPAPGLGEQTDCLSDERCSQLYENARRLSQAGQLTAALAGYQSAYAQTPTPWLLVNIGRLHQKMGRPDLAIRSFRQFLDDPRAAQDEESQRKAQEYLRQAEASIALRAQSVLSSPASEQTPEYKKWWFWAVLGSATAITLGLAVGLGTQQPGVAPGVSTYSPTFMPGDPH